MLSKRDGSIFGYLVVGTVEHNLIMLLLGHSPLWVSRALTRLPEYAKNMRP